MNLINSGIVQLLRTKIAKLSALNSLQMQLKLGISTTNQATFIATNSSEGHNPSTLGHLLNSPLGTFTQVRQVGK